MTTKFVIPLILQKSIWVPTRILLNFFIHFEVANIDNINIDSKNAIFVLNHTSELDPILLPASFPFTCKFYPVFYMSREKEFYNELGWRKIFYGGFIFKMWGAYPVHTGLKDYEKSLTTHKEILRQGGSLCVFPEGGISKDGNIKSAKGGVVYLSHVTKVPIIPVKICGASKMTFLDFILRRRTVSIIFGKVVPAEYSVNSIEDYKNIANELMISRVAALTK